MFIKQPLKTQHPKDMASWTGMQHNLTLKLWTTQANCSWASHMEMLSAAVFLQRCKDLSAPICVYCHACSTSVQCGNPWVQKTRLVSPNKKEQVPTSKTASKTSNIYELQKKLVGRHTERSGIWGLLHDSPTSPPCFVKVFSQSMLRSFMAQQQPPIKMFLESK